MNVEDMEENITEKPEVKADLITLAESERFGEYLYTSEPTPRTVRYAFTDRIFLSRDEVRKAVVELGR